MLCICHTKNLYIEVVKQDTCMVLGEDIVTDSLIHQPFAEHEIIRLAGCYTRE